MTPLLFPVTACWDSAVTQSPIRRLVALSILFLFAAPTAVAYADGFRNPFQGAAAIAQGNAFAAQADDPTAIYYNPAGMTQLHGIQNSVGVQFVSVNVNYTSPTGVTTQNERPFPIGLPPPGQFFLTANMRDLGVRALGDLSLGLGFLNLYGFSLKYPENGPFASAVTRAQLPLLDIKPTAAYRLTDNLSVGLGADIFTFASFIGEGHAERQFVSAGGPVPAGAHVEINGKGTTAGLNASVLYTLLRADNGKPRLNIAAIWRSQAVLPLNGAFLVNEAKATDTKSSILLPESYTVGVAWWQVRSDTHEWKMEFNLDWVRWQSIRNFDVQLSTGQMLESPQNWSNALTYAVGMEYKWLQPSWLSAWDVAVRGGYHHSATPVPDRNFVPTPPDADVHVLSVGAGFFCGESGRFLGLISCSAGSGGLMNRKSLGIDLAYQAVLFEQRTVTGSPNPATDGTYKTTNHIGSVTMRVNF
jgi:long-chain fatty acid transport protein